MATISKVDQTDHRAATRHFEALDGQRGVAALIVLIGHSSVIVLGEGSGFIPRKSLAVLFFFMLSGFVISSAYQERVRKGLAVSEFMLRRVVRLYPMIFVGVALGAIWFSSTSAGFWMNPRSLLALILNSLSLPSPATNFGFGRFPLNPPGWSLFFEMLAYAAFVLWLANSSTRFLVVCVIILSGLFAVVNTYYFNNLPFFFNVFGAGASFCVGVLLWRAHAKGYVLNGKLPSWVVWPLMVVICLAPLSLKTYVDLFALLIVFPFIIMIGAATCHRSAGTFEKLIGELSYPVYIIHWPLLLATQRIVKPLIGGYPALAFGVCSSLLIAWAALRLYDEPMRRTLTDMTRRAAS